jgi:5-methylcytosine-specific restriction endonuclease McrA
MEIPKRLRTYVKNILRRASTRWKPKSKAYDKAKKQIGEYSTGRPKYEWKCAMCSETFKRKDTVADHVDPVIPLEGFKSGLELDLNEYVVRLFCGVDGYQILCKDCHDIKTRDENIIRKEVKKSGKC